MQNIATSPIFYCGSGFASRAVVLRVQLNDSGVATKFVVHDEYHYRDMPKSYGHGDYFLGEGAFEPAYKRWIARSSELAESYPLAATQGGKGADDVRS